MRKQNLFGIAFFNVFGISRRWVATFEQPVKKGDNKQGFIDLLWKKAHQNLDKAVDLCY